MSKAHSEGGGTPPFRFLYMSGVAAERDQSKKPYWMQQYSLMRVSTSPPPLFKSSAETKQTRNRSKLTFLPSLSSKQGEAENQVLAFASEHKGQVEACVAKPGAITGPGQYRKMIFVTVMNYVMSFPSVSVAEVSAAMLHEVIHGFEKEPLENGDLVRIGREALLKVAE